mmetsp:Transcript_9396/g.13982  ORF Transcript_9396/g.13982 Transcript_9396/m.13982 type:complete len:262 (-) Transcript_9396:119-904(-)
MSRRGSKRSSCVFSPTVSAKERESMITNAPLTASSRPSKISSSDDSGSGSCCHGKRNPSSLLSGSSSALALRITGEMIALSTIVAILTVALVSVASLYARLPFSNASTSSSFQKRTCSCAFTPLPQGNVLRYAANFMLANLLISESSSAVAPSDILLSNSFSSKYSFAKYPAITTVSDPGPAFFNRFANDGPHSKSSNASCRVTHLATGIFSNISPSSMSSPAKAPYPPVARPPRVDGLISNLGEMNESSVPESSQSLRSA